MAQAPEDVVEYKSDSSSDDAEDEQAYFQIPVIEEPPLDMEDIPYTEKDAEVVQRFLAVFNDTNLEWRRVDQEMENTHVWFVKSGEGAGLSRGIEEEYPGHVDDLLHAHFVSGDEYMDGIDSNVTEVNHLEQIHPYIRLDHVVMEMPSPCKPRQTVARTVLVRVLSDGTITQPSQLEEWRSDSRRKMLQIRYSVDSEHEMPPSSEKRVTMTIHMNVVGIEAMPRGKKRIIYLGHANMNGMIPKWVVNKHGTEFGAIVWDYAIFMGFSKAHRGTNPKNRFANFNKEFDDWYVKLGLDDGYNDEDEAQSQSHENN